MTEKQKDFFSRNLEIDFSIEYQPYGRYRANVFSQKNGLGIIFRPIKTEIPDFGDLRISETVRNFIKKKNGLILITGPVGSGKTTTLASLINEVNTNNSKHIITIEDPIEFIFENKLSIIEQREVGMNTKSFENGLKYALRQAPDIIMVGEMRDLDTFRLALRAAETGNLVLATLHTSGAARTVARIIDMFPGNEKEIIRQQLSESLIGVIWQQLLKLKDQPGRVIAHEILVNHTGLANTIRKDLAHQIPNLIETGKEYGMMTMKESLESLFGEGLIDEKVYEENIDFINKYL